MFGLTKRVARSWLLAGAVWGVMSGVGAAETISLFNGKNLDGWVPRGPQERNRWVVGQTRLDPQDPTGLVVSPAGPDGGQLVNVTAFRKGSKEKRDDDLYTAQAFADCTIYLEFMLPQDGNSGVYVMGEYELQLKDNIGQKELTFQDLGGIYKVAPPRLNAGRKPGEWQTLVIEFQAPRFRDGVKVSNGRFVRVALNGQVIQENVELTDVTPGGLTKKEVPAGPLMLQGDHSPAAFRKITVTIPSGK